MSSTSMKGFNCILNWKLEEQTRLKIDICMWVIVILCQLIIPRDELLNFINGIIYIDSYLLKSR